MKIRPALAILAIAITPSIVSAGWINPAGTGMNITLTGGEETLIDNVWVTPDFDSANPGDALPISSSSQGVVLGSENDTTFSWDVSYDPDPFLFAKFTVTNLSASAKNFSLSASVPISPTFTNGHLGGSLYASVFDNNGDGSATLGASTTDTDPGIYEGLLDGNLSLQLFGISLSCISGPNCTASGSDYDGLANPAAVRDGDTLPAGLDNSIPFFGFVSADIGIDLDFNLSAGDSVTFEAYFEATPVPLPAAAWLFASALGVFGFSLRKSA